jgi:hypothetical protein
MPNEGSDWLNIYARKSNFYDLGFPRPNPYYTDRVGVASVSQTLLDKASAVASLRQISLSDLIDNINRGAKIDNPDYIISILKNVLKDADYETQRNVLAEFIANLKPGNRNIYIYLISKEFNIPMEELTYVDPAYRNIIDQYFYKKVTYIAPATYRLKDTGDTLSLTYLGGDLTGNKEVMENYETIKEIAERKGILPKDWTEPNEINMEDVFKSLNPFESNTQSPEMIRMESLAGPLTSVFGSESSIAKPSVISSIALSKGSSVASSPSIASGSTSLSMSSSLVSASASIASASESLSPSLTSNSFSSSLSQSVSLSPSVSSSLSSSLSNSISPSPSVSSSTSTSSSISPSPSPSTSSSSSPSIGSPSTSNPWDFAFIPFVKPGDQSPGIQPELGKAETRMSDVAYAFYKLWR